MNYTNKTIREENNSVRLSDEFVFRTEVTPNGTRGVFIHLCSPFLWINEQVHGHRFTWQFIDRYFDEVCVYLDEKFGLIQLQEIIGVSLKYMPPETDDPVKALEQIEESLSEPNYIDILF